MAPPVPHPPPTEQGEQSAKSDHLGSRRPDSPVHGLHNSTVDPTQQNPATARSHQAFEMQASRFDMKYEEFITTMVADSSKLDPTVTLRHALPTGFDIPADLRKELKSTDYTRAEALLYPLLCEFIQFSLTEGTEQKQQTRSSNALCVRDTGDFFFDGEGVPATQSPPASGTARKLRPDLCLYRQEYKGIFDIQSASDNFGKRTKWLGSTVWPLASLFVEVKRGSNHSPFSTASSKDFLGDGSVESRSQLAEYAGELFFHQHRCHAYFVTVWQHSVWFLRCDRTGISITERIDFRAHPLKLVRFFFLVGQMSDIQLGWDPTVTRLGQEDTALLTRWNKAVKDASLAPHIYRRISDRGVFKNTFERYRVEVTDENMRSAKKAWDAKCTSESSTEKIEQKISRKTISLLIGRCDFGYRSHTGRGSRGFIALYLAHASDPKGDKFVYLKDSWRAEYIKREHDSGVATPPETVIYATLDANGVRHIPRVQGGGNVYSRIPSVRQRKPVLQRTLHHDTFKVRSRIHTRLILLDIGRTLSDYRDSKELVKAMHDAILAHRDAWYKAGILHRDISGNNIILVQNDNGEWIGMLIDWDLSKPKHALNKGARNHSRSGTWEYLSALAAAYPLKPYRPSDDLESFMHVLRKFAARFHHSDYSAFEGSARLLLEKTFYPYTDVIFVAWKDHKLQVASPARVKRICEASAPVDLSPMRNSAAFVELIKELTRLCADYYTKALDLEKVEARYGISNLDDGLKCPEDEDDGLSIRPSVQFKFDHDVFIGLFNKALKKETEWKADKIDDQMPAYAKTTAHDSDSWRPSESQHRTAQGAPQPEEPRRRKRKRVE